MVRERGIQGLVGGGDGVSEGEEDVGGGGSETVVTGPGALVPRALPIQRYCILLSNKEAFFFRLCTILKVVL